MRQADIKVGGFYLLRDGTTVRVSAVYEGLAQVWEEKDQEPYEVLVRQLVSETDDPCAKRAIELARRFLRYSWAPVDYKYEQLTAEEKALCTPKEFKDLVDWVK